MQNEEDDAGEYSHLKHLPHPFSALVRGGFLKELIALVQKYGGTRVYVPEKPEGNLIGLIGESAAKELISLVGGKQWLRVPSKSALKPSKKAAVFQALEDGLMPVEIVRKLGVSAGYVATVRRAVGLPPCETSPKKPCGSSLPRRAQ